MRDIKVHNNTVQPWLKQSKTDQARKGATIIIGPSKADICPVHIAKKFLHCRRHAHASDALFRCHDGSLLTLLRLQTLLRKALCSLKLPAELFGTHSLRIGSATAAAEVGIYPLGYHQGHGSVVQRLLPHLCANSTQDSDKSN